MKENAKPIIRRPKPKVYRKLGWTERPHLADFVLDLA